MVVRILKFTLTELLIFDAELYRYKCCNDLDVAVQTLLCRHCGATPLRDYKFSN